jgi:RNA polymerase sigma-70 factor (ECF subfamily)
MSAPARYNRTPAAEREAMAERGRTPTPLFLIPPAEERSDPDLVRAFLRGDASAPAALWDRYAPLVRRITSRAVGPGHEVDDLVQETFLRLYRKLPTLQDPSALRAFVVAITTRVLQTELRARWFKRWLGLFDDGQLPDRPAAGADLEAREALSRFYHLLDRLRPSHRTAFVLRYIEGLELVDVAAATGVSLATIKRWLPRIARRIQVQAERDPLLKGYVTSTTWEGVPPRG